MTKPKREPRTVRLTEIERILTALADRGVVPAVYDLLPGGIVRLHARPIASNDGNAEAEEREWDAALGR